MSNDLRDPKFEGEGPSAAYAFERDRLIHLGHSLEAAHAAGVKAHLAAVFGADAKRDKHGAYIQQGIGSDANPSANSLFAIRKFEGEKQFQAKLRELWKTNPDWCKQSSLEQPARLGE